MLIAFAVRVALFVKAIVGVKVRNAPILASDGRALIVAMDHARTHGAIGGLEDPGAVIEASVNGGADGVVLMAFVGIPVELETYRAVARVAGECLRANLPLVVEALPCPGERIPDPKAPDAMASAARIGFEHGADLVKSYYTEEFSRVTDNCPVPVLIAGGPRMETAEETLQVVHDATQAGAAGVVFGRNIWQSGDTRGMIRALNSIIHEGRPVAEALAESDLA